MFDMLHTVTSITLPVNVESHHCDPMAPKGTDILTPGQCRAARAWLNLSAQEVADKANITRQTVTRFETEKTVATAGTATLIRGALEKLGAEFPDLETVRLRTAQS